MFRLQREISDLGPRPTVLMRPMQCELQENRWSQVTDLLNVGKAYKTKINDDSTQAGL